MGEATALTTVYQYFDSRGQLLYVGITARGIRRAVEHAETKAWWKLAATCSLEHYATRELALEREEQLIKRYSPPFNTVHNSRKQEALDALVPVEPLVRNAVDWSVTPWQAGSRIIPPGSTLAERRSAYYALPAELKKLAMCTRCGMALGDRGPECRPCLERSKVERGLAKEASRHAKRTEGAADACRLV